MADDGLFVNFQLSSEGLASRTTFVGGHWKDRQVARKRERGKVASTFEVRKEEEELVLPDNRPKKRVKTSSQPAQNREVISSLFTCNPASGNAATTQSDKDEEQDASPTNAPLDESLASFTSLGLSPSLANHLLHKLALHAPTAIQRKAIQLLCASDNDAFIQAETGSGKTLAYLLPLLQRITNMSKQMKAAGESFHRDSGLFAIILAPTRELSKQINSVLETLLSCCHWIVGGTVIGGEKKKSEKARLRKGLNVLVATPGRLADHLEHTDVLDVSKVRWLVLDEGDRLMELGFDQDIQKIVSVLNLRRRKAQERPIPGLPERRSTVLCSATIRGDVDTLKRIALKDAVTIAVDNVAHDDSPTNEQVFSAPAQLKQSYAIIPAKQRLVALLATLRKSFTTRAAVKKCIVFMSCADSVDFHFEVLTRKTDGTETPSEARQGLFSGLAPKLSKSGKIPQGNTISESITEGLAADVSTPAHPVHIYRLHGSLQQATRTSTLKAFAQCSEPCILVCTDVASRGLDLPNIDLVVEYDPPFSKDEHLHRIGRTARAGNDGRATIFLLPGCEEGYVEVLQQGRHRHLTRHDPTDLLKASFSATTGSGTRADWESRATEWQLEIERWVLEHPKHLEQARRAFQSHVRAYATHVGAERSVFDSKELHLGHLAKAFALRDKPGSIRVPGQRPGKDANGKAKRVAMAAQGRRSRPAGEKLDVPEAAPEQEARRKMQSMARALGGVDEFNLG